MATTALSADLRASATLWAGHLGGRVQQIRAPDVDDVIQIQLYRAGGFEDPSARRVWWRMESRSGQVWSHRVARPEPNRPRPTGFVAHLRKHLMDRRLVHVRLVERGLALGFKHVSDSEIGWLVADGARFHWLTSQRSLVSSGQPHPATLQRVAEAADVPPPPICPPPTDVELAQADLAQGARLRARRQVLRRRLRSQRRRLTRLIERLEGDLRQTQTAATLREQADLLKTQLHQVPRGADSVTLEVPWRPGERFTIPLRRDLSPVDNMQRMFRRARGFERHHAMISSRLSQAHEEIKNLQAVVDALEEAAPRALDALERQWGSQPHPHGQTKGSSEPRRRRVAEGVQRWLAPEGQEVWLGRSASANDAIVTRVARGRDVWMHVRDRPGAHLVLRWEDTEPPGVELLLRCGALCAWASGVALGDAVEITWTRARHLRKGKGSAPGQVYVAHEKSLRVPVDPEVMRQWKSDRPA